MIFAESFPLSSSNFEAFTGQGTEPSDETNTLVIERSMECLTDLDEAAHTDELGVKIREMQRRNLIILDSDTPTEEDSQTPEDNLLSVFSIDEITRLITSVHVLNIPTPMRHAIYKATLIDTLTNHKQQNGNDPSIIHIRHLVENSDPDGPFDDFPVAS